MPYPAQYGYLTERGTLFYNGKTPATSDSFISDKPYKVGSALEVDWNGRVIWEVQHPEHHRWHSLTKRQRAASLPGSARA
jgi:hypothetical protein